MAGKTGFQMLTLRVEKVIFPKFDIIVAGISDFCLALFPKINKPLGKD
jgi:hypothetical protein